MYERRFNPYAANLEIVKGYFRSGKVLVLAIFNTIIAVLYFFSISFLFESYYDYFYLSFKDAGMPDSAIASFLSTRYVIASIGSLWFILMAVAFFVIFGKSRSASVEASPMGGFTLLKVLAIFQLIGAIIETIFLVLFAVICFVGGAGFAEMISENIRGYVNLDSSALAALMIFVGLLFIIWAFFLLFEAINRLRFISGARKSMNSVQLYNSGAGAYGVVCIILAIFSVFSVVISIFTFSIISIITAILTMVIYIVTAALALGYNSYIKRQKQSYRNSSRGGYDAPSSQTPYASAPAPQTPYTPAYANNPDPVSYSADQQQSTGGFCRSCGAPVGANDPFCGNCGAKL